MNPVSHRGRPHATSRHLFRLIVLALVVSGAPYLGGRVVSARQETPPTYTLVELGAVKNLPYSQAYGINSDGVIVGIAFDPSTFASRATIARNGKLRAMIKGEKGVSLAYDINHDGLVVGSSAASAYDPSVAMLWDGDEGTALTDLNTQRAEAMEINDDGLVVGYYGVDEQPGLSQAFSWSDGTLITLEPLPKANITRATAVNNPGEIVGSSAEYDAKEYTSIEHAVIWRDGDITDLGTLGGDSSLALGINDTGQIVGISTTVPGESLYFDGTHAVLWENDTPTDLGVLKTGAQSRATAINSEGQIVGASSITTDGSSFNRAVLWQNGDIYDLNELVSNLPEGWSLESASDINDAGQIVGFASNNEGAQVSFLLTPED